MLINLRNALMAGKRLPYDAEVEYLESTGTQWIDTGVPANGEFSAQYRLRTDDSNTAQFMAAGARSATQHLNFGQFEPNNGRFTLGYLGTYWTTTSLVRKGKDYDVGINYTNGSQTATVNGTATVSQTLTGTESLNLNIYIFKRNFYGATDTVAPMQGRLYYFKLWRNGVLVRDFIPVRRGTVGYLYDRVSGKLFGNAGTGDFVVGPDVVPVEWLGAVTRDPFINTGVIPTDNTGVYARMWSGDVSTTRPYLGNDQFRISVGLDKAYSHWNGAALSSSLRVDVQSGDITASLNRNADRKFIANGVTAITYTSELNANTNPILLFKYLAASPVTAIPLRFYGVQITEGANVANNFIPVRVGTDATSWEGAMMDVLTRRIYRNAGTGAFTYGNDLKYPIPAE